MKDNLGGERGFKTGLAVISLMRSSILPTNLVNTRIFSNEHRRLDEVKERSKNLFDFGDLLENYISRTGFYRFINYEEDQKDLINLSDGSSSY